MKPATPRKSVPTGPLLKLANDTADEIGVPPEHVYGTGKRWQYAEAVQARRETIRRARARWPNASLCSIAQTLGISKATVLNMLREKVGRSEMVEGVAA